MARTLYVDLNHWIELTKGRLGTSDHARYREAYGTLRDAVSHGELVVPLSSMHYIEMFRIKSPSQRGELALTMDHVSRYVSLTSRKVLIAHELRRSLATVFERPFNAPSPEPLGYGFGHAFGKGTIRGRFRGDPEVLSEVAVKQQDDITRRAEQLAGFGWQYSPPPGAAALERLHDVTDQLTQFWMLRGPDDKDLPALLRDGYNPDASFSVTKAMQRREAELAEQLKKEPATQNRLADFIAARALYWDLLEEWDRAVADVGVPRMSLDEIGKPRLDRIIAGVPIVDVESRIRHRRFRNLESTWVTNDIYDIGFAGQAVVYCDAVLTDKDLRATIVQTRLDRKYRTVLLLDVNALLDWAGAA
jgi:hypothetical protein